MRLPWARTTGTIGCNRHSRSVRPRGKTMNRRQLLPLACCALAGVMGPNTVIAQGGNADAASYRMATLRLGALSLISSRLAARQASNKAVKAFAGFEIGEQETLADVLTGREQPVAMTGNPERRQTLEIENRLDPQHRKILERLRSAQGPEFDKEYRAMQGEGHNELLVVQEQLIAGQVGGDLRMIAMLTRSIIREHQVHIREIGALL